MKPKTNIKTVGKKQLEISAYSKIFTNQKVFPHNHMFFEINVCFSGSFLNIINDEPITFSKGSCGILRPNDVHSFEKNPTESDPYIYQDVYIPMEKMKKCCDFLSSTLFDEITNNPKPICFSLSNKEFGHISELLSVFKDIYSFDTQYIESIHMSVIIDVLSSYLNFLHNNEINVFPQWINSLLVKINDLSYLSKTELEISKEYGYTICHFSREFKKYVKVPFAKYFTIKKINTAADLLLTTDMSVLEISRTLGYASLSPFNRNFKEYYNCSPLQYRKTFKINY